MSSTLRLGRFAAMALATALVATGLTVFQAGVAQADELPSPPRILQRDDSVVTADPLPTIQLDSGYVWAQTMIGDIVYAAGSFSNARAAGTPAGGATTPRANVLAYNITTGELTSFAPQVNGVVRSIAASPDGSRIYLGGSFNTVNAQTRYNFAAVDATTGALVPGFSPSIGGSGVYAIVANNDAVYLGGLFTAANATARKNLAAFSTANGALLGWAPTTDLQVDAAVMEPTGTKLIIGGRFANVNGVSQRGLAALDLVSGAIMPWAAPATVRNGASSGDYAGKAGIFGLATDANTVYGTGWVYANVATGNLEGVFAAEKDTGDIRWVADCHGDHYGVYSTGKTVYATSHTHQCETVGLAPEMTPRTYRYAEAYTAAVGGVLTRSASVSDIYADWSGTPAPSPYAWYPDFTVGTASGLGQAGLSITGNGDYISIGGEFGSVNNRQFYGLVRFSTKPTPKASQGPRVSADNWTAVATSQTAGNARITVPANWDRDDRDLTYELYRQGTSTPVASTVVASTWFNLPTVSLSDTGQVPGSTQNYRVVVKDRDGNSVTGNWVPVTISSVVAPYGAQVLADGASLYYRLGTDTTDWTGGPDPVFGSSVTSASPGATADANTSASVFNGSSTSTVRTSTTRAVPSTFSVEAWFKTNTTRGGKILGYGSSATGNSSNYDRQLYMLNNGRVSFGVYNGATTAITTTSALNNNQWHHIVGTQGADGLKLYVDGVLQASNASATTAQAFTGYWRIGGDNIGGWPNQPSNSYFVGSIDDVAVYPTALTAGTVAAHSAIGRGQTPPTASFASSVTDLTASFDASATTAASGRTIADYSWSFGDGSTGNGATATHSYATAGTYQVTLTATDDGGLAGSTTQSVTVTAPNQPPVVSFTSSTAGLTASVNASASTDPDGTIVSYSWNWGDGTPAGSGTTAAHKYAQPGTYQVTVTATDDDGAVTTSAPTAVTVTHADPVASFTSTAAGMGVTVDASASTASDGATLSYSWNWGDGTPAGTGATAAHSYATAGSYTVTLTVTDSVGSSATATRTTTASSVSYVVQDDFGRSTTSSWGAADVGGSYSILYGAASAASVTGGKGVLTLPAGNTRTLMLQSASAQETSASVDFSISQAPSTGSNYVGLISRQKSGADDNYTVRAWMRNDASVWLVLQKGSTVLKSGAVSGLTWAANDVFTLKTSVTGTSPTTITAKIWKSGTTEPAAAQLSTTDSTAALQSAGYVGVHANRSGSASSTAAFSFDNLRVSDGSGTPQPPVNVAPTAAFTSTSTNLNAAVDGTGSSDTDGTIASYAWNWGDGTAAGSGATATHSYSAAGTYQVTLTVTDNGGKTASVTNPVTVTAPPPSAFLVQDDFSRTVASGWGSADTGGAYTVLYGAASSASVASGTGAVSLAAGNTRSLMLQSASARDTTSSVVFSLNQAPSTGSNYVGLIARQQAGADDNYTVRTWLRNDGTVWLVIQKGSTVLKSAQISGVTWAAGDQFTLQTSVVGASPTTISAKLWKVGTTEPASPQLTTTDSTAAVQNPGYLGVHANRAGSATTTGVFTFDTLRVSVVN
ncbi:MAG: hypothetical protein DI534_13570 [Leifsonia xyli]|nr:MAG: hypothetical protein DI534_13570 [Leifsonia xyli]